MTNPESRLSPTQHSGVNQDFHFGFLDRTECITGRQSLVSELQSFGASSPKAAIGLGQAPSPPYREDRRPRTPFFSVHSPKTSPALTSWPVRCRCIIALPLPGRDRQRFDPPYHAPEQPPGEMTLGQRTIIIDTSNISCPLDFRRCRSENAVAVTSPPESLPGRHKPLAPPLPNLNWV